MNKIQIKRAYLGKSEEDGYRILVDRLWPRGLSKEKVQLDLWKKEISPSQELRKWFGHEAEKFNEFAVRYCLELEKNNEALNFAKMCRELLNHQNVTFVFGAKDCEHNNAVVLKKWIEKLL